MLLVFHVINRDSILTEPEKDRVGPDFEIIWVVTPLHPSFVPLSVLQSMSKTTECTISEQKAQYFVGILSPLLSGFRQG